jgi:hypothetical protein
MFDAAKARLARRSALKQVRRRAVRPWTTDPAHRRVLVVVRTGDEAAHEAWRFVSSLGIPPQRIIPVVLSGQVTHVPAEYITRLIRLDDENLNFLGLPKKDFAQRVWSEAPDVAFSLSPAFDIAAAALVGASPAPFRVGLYSDEDVEPFFDLMLVPAASLPSSFETLRQTLARITPPVLTIDPAE